MNAPIRYFGGKGTMYKKILQHFPPSESYRVYVEPFAGSFVMCLKKAPCNAEIYNDLDHNVYALFKVLQDTNLFAEFYKKCELLLYGEAIREEYKAALKNKNLGLIDRAFAFFVVNRMSVQGTGGFSVNRAIRRNMSKSTSDFLSTIDNLLPLHERLSRVVVLNQDALSVIKRYDHPDAFMYLDPPYLPETRSSGKYNVDMTTKQHMELLDVLSSCKSKILLSGYGNSLYNSALKGWKSAYFQVKTQNTQRKPKTKTEALWCNYPLCNQ